MAKRPLSVQLRPCSAVEPVSASSHAAAGANSRSARRLSMGDIILDQHRLSAELTNRAGQHGGSNPAAGRRPADLCIAVGPCSVAAGGLPRRRDRCSPSWCKRPIVTTLPRLDLSLIQESSLWNDESSVGQGDCQGQTPSRDCRVPCCYPTLSVPTINKSSSSSSLSSSSSSYCECLGPASLTTSCAASASESSSLLTAELTSILPFLYLGSQRDALSPDIIRNNGIEYVLNVSATCPQSPFVAESNFLRIPVNDGHQDRLLPFFADIFHFLDSVRESSGRVLVHCLAGISRSPTIVIAYVMHHLRLSIDDAYRYVKDRRPSISPNFNFLGQLVEFDAQLTKQRSDESTSSSAQTSESSGVTEMNVETPERVPSPSKRPCMINLSRAVQSTMSLGQPADVVTAQSPTVALSRLQFVEQRQPSSAAAVNVPPKSTTADELSSAFRSKFTRADTGGVTQQHVKKDSSSSVTWSQQTTSSTACGGEMLPVNVEKEMAEAAGSGREADMLLVDWQTAASSCKSRSLEDILLISASPPRSLGHGQGQLASGWTPGDDGHDKPRLTSHASLTTSHSSLGTGHGSLHGSLEMIQVS